MFICVRFLELDLGNFHTVPLLLGGYAFWYLFVLEISIYIFEYVWYFVIFTITITFICI